MTIRILLGNRLSLAVIWFAVLGINSLSGYASHHIEVGGLKINIYEEQVKMRYPNASCANEQKYKNKWIRACFDTSYRLIVRLVDGKVFMVSLDSNSSEFDENLRRYKRSYGTPNSEEKKQHMDPSNRQYYETRDVTWQHGSIGLVLNQFSNSDKNTSTATLTNRDVMQEWTNSLSK